jgi:hypothetical protein
VNDQARYGDAGDAGDLGQHLGAAFEDFLASKELLFLFGHMAERRMRNGETEKYPERLFPRTKNQKERVPSPFAGIESERSSQTRPSLLLIPAITLWGLYNAVVRDEDFRATRESTPSA